MFTIVVDDQLGEPDLLQAGADLKVVLGRITRRMRQWHAPGELTFSEMSVLARLDRDGPATPGVLADGEHVRPQAMGATLAALEQRDLVCRAPDPGDGRRVLMSISTGGRQLLLDTRSRNIRAVTAALARGFSPVEQRQLIAVIPLLERLADNL
jgi:DNA-binding MarR family transcriptional regulator